MKFAAVRKFALALPEVTEEPHHEFGSFRVRSKIFVTVPPDHEHVHIFVSEEDRKKACALHPECVEELLWGGKVVGIRLSLGKATAAVVNGLVQQAWHHKAPKALRSREPR